MQQWCSLQTLFKLEDSSRGGPCRTRQGHRLLHCGASGQCQLPLQVHEEPPWQVLATTTHATPHTQQESTQSSGEKPWVEAWQRQLQDNELQLLQLHMFDALDQPGDGDVLRAQACLL